MSRIIHIEAIKNSGYRTGFIAEKIGADKSMLSRWLHGTKGSKLNNEQVQRLEKFLGI